MNTETLTETVIETRLEEQYALANKQLNAKLNKLLYLQSLKKLSKLSDSEIDGQLASCISSFPKSYFNSADMTTDNLKDINTFLKQQTVEVKSEAFLCSYLPALLKMISSIHGNNAFTASDLKYKDTVRKLYLDEKEPVGMYSLLKSIDSISETAQISAKLYPQVNEKLQGLLQVEVPQLVTASQRLTDLELDLIKEQEAIAKQVKNNDPRIKELRKRLIVIQKLMKRITVFANLIPGLIMGSYEGNWASKEQLFEAVVQSEEISETFEVFKKFCLIDIKECNTEELLAIDLRRL